MNRKRKTIFRKRKTMFRKSSNIRKNVNRLICVGLIVFILPLLAIVVNSNFNNSYDENEFETVIILGAGLYGDAPSPILKNRLDKYIEEYDNINAKTLVLSGGQGADELISEAAAMDIYLSSKIEDYYKLEVILENKSTSTYENLLFSKELIDIENEGEILVITNGFHTLRAGLLAESLDMNVSTLSAKTPNTAILKYYLREVLALYENIVKYIIIN